MSNRELMCLKEIERITFPVGSKYLSKVMDIPQGTIGKILIQLEDQGFVEKQSNKGRVITEKGKSRLERYLVEKEQLKAAERIINTVKFSSKDRLLEILEARRLLEGAIIGQACEKATEAEILELKRIMLDHKKEIISGGLGNVEDFQLHTTLARISRNQVFYEILVLILTKENASTKFSMVADQVLHTQLNQHQAIVDAVSERNAKKAEKAMDDHLLTVIDDVNKYYSENELERKFDEST